MRDILKIGCGTLSVGLVLGMGAVGNDDALIGAAWGGAGDGSELRGEFIDEGGADAPVAMHSAAGERSERKAMVDKVLDTCTIERVVFDSTPISDVVAYLRDELEERGLGTININYNPPSDAVEGSIPEPTVTVVLSGVTLRELLVTICRNAGCVFNVTGSGIDVYRQNDPASRAVETRTWCNVPLSFFPGVAGRTTVDMTEYLVQLSLKFDVKGATAYYDPRLSQLTVTGTLENLDVVDAFIYAARLRLQGETE